LHPRSRLPHAVHSKRHHPMPPLGKNSSVPELSRTTSATPTNSIAASESGSVRAAGESAKFGSQEPWMLFFPAALSTTIIAWAMKAKAHVRQHATSCCAGDLCGPSNSEMIPDEIVIQSSGSLVGENIRDIELMPVSTFDEPGASLIGFEVGGSNSREPWRAPLQIRRTNRWNKIPDDPVDEVSLKGSSYDCSSDDEDERKDPK
jgi:hypothetical protein